MPWKNKNVISLRTRISAPPWAAWHSVRSTLRQMKQSPTGNRLSIEFSDVQAPIEGAVSVPVRINLGPPLDHLMLIEIEGERPRLFPSFAGVLSLQQAGDHETDLCLDGYYTVPLGELGHSADITLLRGAAAASLQRFLDGVAARLQRARPA